MNNTQTSKINILDLFAGAGGMSTGFELTNLFSVAVANEINKSASETHKYNHKNCVMIQGDILDEKVKNNIITKAIELKIQGVSGGPPCKGISNSGDKDPRDPRTKLYIPYLEVISKVDPDFFVMENVPGIKNMRIIPSIISETFEEKYGEDLKAFNILQDKKNRNGCKRNDQGERIPLTTSEQKEYRRLKKIINKHISIGVLDDIIKRSDSIGYKIVHKKVLESQYHSVPQKRKRMIIIGIKKSFTDIKEIEIKRTTPDNFITVKRAIDDLKDHKEDKMFSHVFRKYKNKTIPQKILDCKYGKSYTGNYAESNNKCHPDKPSNTVKENHGAVMTHYEKGRHLTSRELARLQSFPDTFIFPCSETSARKQIGNAVPCNLARDIGASIHRYLYSPS